MVVHLVNSTIDDNGDFDDGCTMVYSALMLFPVQKKFRSLESVRVLRALLALSCTAGRCRLMAMAGALSSTAMFEMHCFIFSAIEYFVQP
jgi:hypothetical protein